MTKKKANDFDSVAWIYDKLSKLIFGNSLLDAQKCFVSEIKDGSDVLILGGGTGELLVEIINLKSDCRICYVDASDKMIELARKKISENIYVDFVHGTEHDIPAGKKFDVVITNFYFDLFNPEYLSVAIKMIKEHLKSDGTWLVTDFVRTERMIDRTLLRLMYMFFKVMSNIEASYLPEWEHEMKRHFTETRSAVFRKGFVKSVLYGY